VKNEVPMESQLPTMAKRPISRRRRRWQIAGGGAILVALLGISGAIFSNLTGDTRFSAAVHTGSTSRSTTSSSAQMPQHSSALGAATGASFQSSSSASDMPSAAGIKDAAQPSTQRLVIETANLSLTTANVVGVSRHVSHIAAQDGGFVQSMQQTGSKQSTLINLTVRIPEADFQTFLSASKAFGTVTQFTQTGQDVTQAHGQLQAQLSELHSEVTAYTRLFNRAQSMQDMLQIQQSLTQVDSQIADLTNQLNSLNRSIQLATVNLTLAPASAVVTPTTRTLAVFTSLRQSVHFMGESALAVITFIAWILPWGVVAGLAYAGYRWWSRRRSPS